MCTSVLLQSHSEGESQGLFGGKKGGGGIRCEMSLKRISSCRKIDVVLIQPHHNNQQCRKQDCFCFCFCLHQTSISSPFLFLTKLTSSRTNSLERLINVDTSKHNPVYNLYRISFFQRIHAEIIFL